MGLHRSAWTEWNSWDCPGLPGAAQGPHGLLEFVARLRLLSGGRPVGFKLCVGSPVETMGIVQAGLCLNPEPLNTTA